MPGLHFLSDNEAFSSPSPLLLGAILYVAALHHPSAKLAALAPDYFIALCRAIAYLSVPATLIDMAENSACDNLETAETAKRKEKKAFEDVLGIIIAGLVSEAFIEVTGVWISVAYRLLLDNCPSQTNQKSRKWRGLFSGLQVSLIYMRLFYANWIRSLTSNTPLFTCPILFSQIRLHS